MHVCAYLQLHVEHTQNKGSLSLITLPISRPAVSIRNKDSEQGHLRRKFWAHGAATFLVPVCLLTPLLCVSLKHKGSVQEPSLCQGWLATIECTLLDTWPDPSSPQSSSPTPMAAFSPLCCHQSIQELRCLLAALHDLLAQGSQGPKKRLGSFSSWHSS